MNLIKFYAFLDNQSEIELKPVMACFYFQNETNNNHLKKIKESYESIPKHAITS